jgi:zinc transporter ZupT
MEQTAPERDEKKLHLPTALLLLLPLIALGGVIALFLVTGGGLDLASPAPVEALTFERTVLQPGKIVIHIRNSGPQDLTVAQVVINEAIWPFTIVGTDQRGHPEPTHRPIPRLGRAAIVLDYGWSEGEAYGITLFTTNAIAFSTDIPVAFVTPEPTERTFLNFTLIGVYVGIIPVYLGIFWLPALRKLGRKWMVFLLSVTVGILVFLGIDTFVEAIEQAGGVPGPFQWSGLIGIGAVGTFALLAAVSRQQSRLNRNEAQQRISLAFMIALGIGIHNLGEGLAIGAAYNLGEITLGAFLVVGFIIQNITEGLGIIAPVVRDRPEIKQLVLLGLLGGGPAVLGAWIGGFAPSPTLAVLFLAVGTGAIFEVVYEILQLIGKDTSREPMPMTVFSGLVSGMLLLWVTGLLIK